MKSIDRRGFLQDAAGLLGAVGMATLGRGARAAEASKASPKKVGPNELLRVACIGVHGQGRGHLGAYSGMKETVVATICDVDSTLANDRLKMVEDRQGTSATFVQDLRRVMDDKSIDAVSIATPNHWHALAAIWAMQAGKDVYVEKPVSHNVSEGRRMVEAARHYKKICQTGTQSRSNEGMRQTIDFIHSGKIGKVYLSRGLCYKGRGSIGKSTADMPVPTGVDYDLWVGPAAMRPLRRQRFHYDWHWFWDYGSGDLGNQGIHEMDKARWGLGQNELPKSVLSIGGRFGYEDDGETANTQICLYDYGDQQLIFEVRGLKTNDLLGARVGNIWYGTEGYVVSTSYSSGAAFTPKGEKIAEFSGGEDRAHFKNFIKAVKSRRHEDLNADILEGHLSSALCHLGNVSYRLGTMQPFNRQTKAFGDDKEAYESFTRMAEHLAKDNGLAFSGMSYRLGRKLTLDAKAERFVGDSEADALLTRKYREPFVVPAKIGVPVARS